MSKTINKCTKKDALGPTAGHGVTMLPCCSLWLLRCHRRSGTEASRRGNNWMSECRPDMIRMIENHRFLMCFLTLEEQNWVTAQAKRNFSLLSHTPANRNECPCCKHFLTTPANTSILSLSLKSEFQIRHPCKGAKSTGCLVYRAITTIIHPTSWGKKFNLNGWYGTPPHVSLLQRHVRPQPSFSPPDAARWCPLVISWFML